MPRPSSLGKESHPSGSEDAILLRRLQVGDVSAFETLVRSHGASLIRYASRITGSDDRAQEVVQDVFLKLWNERSDVESTFNLSAYLYWLVRNRAVNIARSDLAALRRDGQWVQETGQQQAVRNVADAELEAADTRAEVWDALGDVPPRCREIFMLVWDKQLTYAEISRMLGITVPTIRSQMSRALKHLVEVLGPRLGEGK